MLHPMSNRNARHESSDWSHSTSDQRRLIKWTINDRIPPFYCECFYGFMFEKCTDATSRRESKSLVSSSTRRCFIICWEHECDGRDISLSSGIHRTSLNQGASSNYFRLTANCGFSVRWQWAVRFELFFWWGNEVRLIHLTVDPLRTGLDTVSWRTHTAKRDRLQNKTIGFISRPVLVGNKRRLKCSPYQGNGSL